MVIFDYPLRSALEIDEFTANPRLAQLIPARLAHRYHTLPIAESDGCLTVVMADPEDLVAQEQIRRVINRPVHIVRGEQRTIDTLIAELWPGTIHRRLHLALLAHDFCGTSLLAFGLALGRRLEADEVHVETLSGKSKSSRIRAMSNYDLVVTDDPVSGRLRERIKKAGDRQDLVRAKTSFLIARETCWPIKTVVCVLRGQASDLGSARWVARLTHSTDCHVEVVVIVPQVPWMYAGLTRMQSSLDELLQENSLPGRHLRRAVAYLCNWEVSTSLRLLHGYSPAQIEAELRAGHPDLMVISAHEPKLAPGMFQDDLVRTLVSCGESSLLVGRSIPRGQ